MAQRELLSPHLIHNPFCGRCREDATKYNHCSWCGQDFHSHEALKDHLRDSQCGTELVMWAMDDPKLLERLKYDAEIARRTSHT